MENVIKSHTDLRACKGKSSKTNFLLNNSYARIAFFGKGTLGEYLSAAQAGSIFSNNYLTRDQDTSLIISYFNSTKIIFVGY